MTFKPAGIIFVNQNIPDTVKSMLVKQLFVSATYTAQEFDNIILSNPTYPTIVKSLDLRIMVLRDGGDLTNRDQADIVAYVTNGLISTEKNNYGPPVNSLPVVNIYWGALGKF